MSNGVSVPNGALVLVADHSKVLLLKNNGTPIAPVLEVTRVIEAAPNPMAHDQGTDRPGTVFSGSHHSEVAQTDWHQVEGRRFLEHAADTLEKARTEGDFDAIVLIAPPKALAELREAISDSVKELIVGELDKDLTKIPVTEIARHLAT